MICEIAEFTIIYVINKATLMPPIPRYFFILAIALATISVHTGCQKPPHIQPSPPPVDSVAPVDTNTTKPPPVDTIHNVASVEESGIYQLYRLFTFTFDSSKRLVSVLINNYGGVLYDSGTCRLFYHGNSSKAFMIITIQPVANRGRTFAPKSNGNTDH